MRTELVATRLEREPGFAWLDGEAFGGELLVRPLVVLRQHGDLAIIDGPAGQQRCQAPRLGLLDAALRCWSGVAGACLVGYLGYELAWALEPLAPCPADDLGLPDLHLALYDAAMRPNAAGRWEVHGTDCFRGGNGLPFPARRYGAWLAEARQERPADRDLPPVGTAPVHARPSAEAYLDAVRRTVERIHAGEIYQANLCRRLEAPLRPNASLPLFLRLRRASPASHRAYLRLAGDGAVLSASPECFLQVRGRRVESRPIKGTRPRGATAEQDRRLAAELGASDKDRAELAMIVDLVRNDLGRVCAPGSVQVVAHAELYSLSTVHHTVSRIQGELRRDRSIADLVRATFPAGSITGAPKIEAMNVAAREEPNRRGPAMGAIGRLDLDGNVDLSVAIRTAVCVGDRVCYHAGGGLVADSVPAEELAETEAKSRAFRRALAEPASPTMTVADEERPPSPRPPPEPCSAGGPDRVR